ncbi:MAG: glycine cleavage T C-terminal barrel domain-containing protein, partial [Ignavibacteria bacterium]|nr:glycine cleavage T C-terminal barrel domain-containing protein [Ignavibacteria bacterium]
FAWMQKNNSFGVELINASDEYSLLAVQGPNSKKIIEKLYGKEIPLEYYHFLTGKILDVEMILSRTGYTGELGYELYFKGDEQTAEKIWNALFEAGKEFDIQPVGLGARDSLRLEMGYCLYGNDIDQTTNPLEAGLGWITRLSKPHFIGKEALMKIKESGLKRKLTPLVIEERAFPRHGYRVAFRGEEIGIVTSGTVSPVLEKGIALAYLSADTLQKTKEVQMLIRGREIPAQVGRLPFISK